jgi:hypothetical protein
VTAFLTFYEAIKIGNIGFGIIVAKILWQVNEAGLS